MQVEDSYICLIPFMHILYHLISYVLYYVFFKFKITQNVLYNIIRNKDLTSPVEKLSQRRFISVYDETADVEIKLWGKHQKHTQPPKGTVINATCLTVDSYLNRKSLNSIMPTVRTLVSNLPNPIQVFFVKFPNDLLMYLAYYTLKTSLNNCRYQKGQRCIWDY